MILVHLSINNKPALIDEKNILFAEECEGKDQQGNNVEFTRIYFKQPLTTEEPIGQVDIIESVEKMIKLLK